MSTLEEIEAAIDKLPLDQVMELGEWLRDRIGDEWDRQIEDDVHSGRLRAAAQSAIEEHRAGKSSDFPGNGE